MSSLLNLFRTESIERMWKQKSRCEGKTEGCLCTELGSAAHLLISTWCHFPTFLIVSSKVHLLSPSFSFHILAFSLNWLNSPFPNMPAMIISTIPCMKSPYFPVLQAASRC